MSFLQRSRLSRSKKVREKVDIDLEHFIHGAMCIHYSGRCMLSNYFSEEMPIVEDVHQSCRWYYDIYETSTVKS
ncbi:MAG: U32 family peptidase [Faecalibacillus faecis]